MALVKSRFLVAITGALFLGGVFFGCAGTRKEQPAGSEASAESVLGVGQENKQASSTQGEEDVLKLLGITEEKKSEETTKEVVQKTEVEKLQEQMMELKKSLKQKEAQIADLKAKLAAKEKEISQLKSAKPAALATSVTPMGKPHPPSQEFKVRYEDALAEYRARNYATALKLFQQLLATDPNNTLSDNCQYWIGECYYGMGKYDQALVEFEKVFAFPETNKAADAQLKIAYCYFRLGERERARQELQRFLDNYPDSEYVPKAQALLSQL